MFFELHSGIFVLLVFFPSTLIDFRFVFAEVLMKDLGRVLIDVRK